MVELDEEYICIKREEDSMLFFKSVASKVEDIAPDGTILVAACKLGKIRK